jgi:4-hydroxybenzoate polyprenyltransferase
MISTASGTLNAVTFLPAYVVTMRPYLLPVSCITGLAGLAFNPDVPASIVAAIGIASFLSYGFGQALTDCFQQDTDRISSPYRPLVQGVITPGQVVVVSLIGLAACIGVFALLNPLTLALGALAAIGLATYTPFKRRWWAGPWYNAWIVAVLFLMGFLAGSGARFPPPQELPGATAAVLFGYANFVLAGYFKDVTADAATGYRTLPVVFGRKVASVTSDILAALFAITVLLTLHAYTTPTVLFLTAGMAALLSAQFLLHRVRKDADAHRPVALVVHGYLLMLSALAADRQPSWVPLLFALYGIFILLMATRPERTQV